MTLDAERQGFRALQQQKSVKRRNCRSHIAEQNCANVSDKSRRTNRIGKRYTVVTGVGVGDAGVIAAFFPIEFARFHDNAAERRAVTAYKFCRRMNNDVRTVFNGANEVRCAESVVNDEGQTVLMGNGGNFFDVRYVAVGVAQGFKIHGAVIFFDCAFDFGKVVSIDKRSRYAVLGQRVRQ